MTTYEILVNSHYGRVGNTIQFADSMEVMELLQRGFIGHVKKSKPVKKQTYKPNEKKA
jgi:hypothetical protein